MAGLSFPETLEIDKGRWDRRWTVVIDARGVVQSADGDWPMVSRSVTSGSSYYGFVAEICGENHDGAAAVSAGIRAVAGGQADTFSLEFPCCLPDGAMRMRVVATRSGEGTLLMHSDADRTPPAEDEYDPQAHRLELLGRLTGGVAHDFANLVTLMAGYSDILLKRIDAQDPVRPELEEIRKAAAQGAGITAQILDFARKQAELPTLVNLSALVVETLKLLRPILGEHVSIATTLEPDLGLVNADPAQMTRVVMNLVLNARDAMPRGGRATMSTANVELGPDGSRQLPAGQYVTLEIADTGAGMDEQTLRRIFQPFFTTKEGRGTGIGLSTVQRIVTRAKGEIRVRSALGQGTTFTVWLPRARQIGETPGSHAAARAAGAGAETILLAEDEESVRELLKRVLADSNYRVLEAADGREALRVFEQHAGTIDLLLTDVVMPGMGGRELAETAMARKPGLKVIYMSGYADDAILNTSTPGPGMQILSKPLQLGGLTAAIREVLDRAASTY